MPLKDFRSIHLPYCIQRKPDGRYMVLNREYMPLGWRTKKGYPDEGLVDSQLAVSFKGLTARVAEQLSFNGKEELETIYLYNDGCIPTESAEAMNAYMRRLAILAKLPVTNAEDYLPHG